MQYLLALTRLLFLTVAFTPWGFSAQVDSNSPTTVKKSSLSQNKVVGASAQDQDSDQDTQLSNAQLAGALVGTGTAGAVVGALVMNTGKNSTISTLKQEIEDKKQDIKKKEEAQSAQGTAHNIKILTLEQEIKDREEALNAQKETREQESQKHADDINNYNILIDELKPYEPNDKLEKIKNAAKEVVKAKSFAEMNEKKRQLEDKMNRYSQENPNSKYSFTEYSFFEELNSFLQVLSEEAKYTASYHKDIDQLIDKDDTIKENLGRFGHKPPLADELISSLKRNAKQGMHNMEDLDHNVECIKNFSAEYISEDLHQKIIARAEQHQKDMHELHKQRNKAEIPR